MTVYRIQHIPTGLFYCPSRQLKVKLADDDRVYRYLKSNLSKTGKTYLKKPTVKHLGRTYYTHLITSSKELSRYNTAIRPVLNSEWQIVEIQ